MAIKTFDDYPVKEKLDALINLNLATRSYVFLKADERWLGWLYENSFLDIIIEESKKSDRTRYDLPEMNYLIKMSQIKPEKTADVLVNLITKMPKKEIRCRVFMGILEICVKVPPAQLSVLLEVIYLKRWIQFVSVERGSLASMHYKNIFKILANAKCNKELLRLAEELLEVKKNAESKEQNRYLESEDDTFNYGDLVETEIFQSLLNIPSNYVEQALDVVTKVMQKVIKLSDKSYAVRTFMNCDNYNFIEFDFFELKINSIDEWRVAQNQIRVGALIVYFARKLFGKKPLLQEDAHVYYEKYIGDFDKSNARLPDTPAMWRLRLFILSLAPNLFQDKLQSSFLRLFKDKYYYDISAGTEYKKTLKKCFGYLSQDNQTNYVKEFLGYFSSVIEDAKFKKDIRDEEKNNHISKEAHRDMGSRIISMIESHLTDGQKQEAKEIGLNISSDYEPAVIFKMGSVSWVPNDGPISYELFAKLSISDIVTKLCNEWSPNNLKDKYKIWDNTSLINESGVSDLLEKNIPERLQEYINEANQFFAPQKIDFFYTSAYLLGLSTTITKIPSLALECNWGPVIDICADIKDYCIEELSKEEQVRGSRYEISGDSQCKIFNLHILNFLQIIFSVRHKGDVIDLSKYHTKTLNLLNCFFEDSDPISEIIKYSGNYSSKLIFDRDEIDDPYATAVQSIRGRAFVVLMHLINNDIDMKKPYMGEDIKGKVKLLYEEVLNKENTRAIMFLFGYHLSAIYHWDAEWSLRNINMIFTEENEKRHLYTAAWEGLLSDHFSGQMFFEKEIQLVYLRGMELNRKDYPLQKHYRDPDELIGEHIAWAFVAHYKQFGFEHRLFKAFVISNNLKRYSQFISYIGSAFISNSDMLLNAKERKDFVQRNYDIKKRFCELWDWMLNNCKHRKALIGFGSWLSLDDGMFEDEWLVDRLLKTLEKTDGSLSGYNLHIVVTKLAKKFPLQVLEIVRLCMLRDDDKDEEDQLYTYFDFSKWTGIIRLINEDSKTELKEEIKAELKTKLKNLINDLIEKKGDSFRWLKELIE